MPEYFNKFFKRLLSHADPSATGANTQESGCRCKRYCKQLKNTFNKSKNDIAKLLKGGGFTKTQIAVALKSGLSANATQTGSSTEGRIQ